MPSGVPVKVMLVFGATRDGIGYFSPEATSLGVLDIGFVSEDRAGNKPFHIQFKNVPIPLVEAPPAIIATARHRFPRQHQLQLPYLRQRPWLQPRLRRKPRPHQKSISIISTISLRHSALGFKWLAMAGAGIQRRHKRRPQLASLLRHGAMGLYS